MFNKKEFFGTVLVDTIEKDGETATFTLRTSSSEMPFKVFIEGQNVAVLEEVTHNYPEVVIIGSSKSSFIKADHIEIFQAYVEVAI